jgi:outer membrane murein-binding lipoprotein Lpp
MAYTGTPNAREKGVNMRTGFCSECQSNVYLDGNGNCVNGHPATAVTGVSVVADAPDAAVPAAPEAPPVIPVTPTTPIHRRRWFLPAIVFIGGLIVGAVMASTSSVVSSINHGKVAMLQSENESLKAQIASLANKTKSLQAELDPIKRAKAAADAGADKVAAAAAAGKVAPSGGMGGPSPNTGSTKVALPADTFPPGVYLVGTDIPAGTYLGTPVTGGYPVPYWKISSLANGADIVQNNRPTGQFYVQVKKGQYLTLDSVVIALIK